MAMVARESWCGSSDDGPEGSRREFEYMGVMRSDPRPVRAPFKPRDRTLVRLRLINILMNEGVTMKEIAFAFIITERHVRRLDGYLREMARADGRV